MLLDIKLVIDQNCSNSLGLTTSHHILFFEEEEEEEEWQL